MFGHPTETNALQNQDNVFENMSFDNWKQTMTPKVTGSWNLHELLPKDMDFCKLFHAL